MSVRYIVAAVFLLLLIAFIYTAVTNNDASEQAQQLARRSRTIDAVQGGNSNPPAIAYDERMLRLTETLLAEAEDDDLSGARTWTISTSKSDDATVIVPFRPAPRRHDEVESPTTSQSQRENPGFVGADACRQCHQETHRSFVETAHHKTSSPVTPDTIHAPLNLSHSLAKKTWPFQVNLVRDAEQYLQKVESGEWSLDVPMDIVTGSAKSGQTFLFWSGDALFQCFVSYLTSSKEWIASPGFSATEINFSRPIPITCLECHITYIEPQKDSLHYCRDTAILGISCERCHGPGQKHIDFHESNPKQPAQFVTQPSRLTRNQQLDICGQCHSGSFDLRKPAFSYRPGDDLDSYHKIRNQGEQAGGVHTSNQRARLIQSQCFQKSEMVCTTCHDPHHNERGNTALFSKHCLKCHSSDEHPPITQYNNTLTENCIDCHMPDTVDKEMSIDTSAGVVFTSMADHFIRVDQAASDQAITASRANEQSK